MGRRTMIQSFVTVDLSASVVLVPHNEKRVALVVSPPPSGTVYISHRSPATGTQGMPLQPGTLPFQLTDEVVGDGVKETFYVIASGTSVTLTVWEIQT